MSGRTPTEICAVWPGPDGSEIVRTGIYVFDTTTIREIRELLACFAEGGAKPPSKFEI